jgi:hypothetical protein
MKVCSKCYIAKVLDDFFKKSSAKDGRSSTCKKCHKVIQAKYYKENKEKVALHGAKYYEKNKEKIAISRAKYNKENKEKKLALRRKYKIKAIDTLNDCYVKEKLRIKGIDIPQELIELKRIQLLIKRELRK